jgi:hypothetical protein
MVHAWLASAKLPTTRCKEGDARGGIRSLPLSMYRAPGACGNAGVVPQNRPKAR